MSEISELERRITAAMDRIASGVETLSARPDPVAEPEVEAEAPAPQGESAEATQLRAQLDEEKLANAQLEERVKALRAKLSKQEAEADLAQKALQGDMVALDAQLQELKQTCNSLRDSNAALRQAQEEALNDPALINASLAAELAALKAERASEAAETAAIVTALEPLLNAAEEKESTDA